MDPLTQTHLIKTTPRPHPHSSHTSFPIIAVAVIGILATAFLLISYYVFVIKCCLNWHRIDLLRRFSFSRNRRRMEAPSMAFSPALQPRGLDESIIRSIPIFQFKKNGSLTECAVCLNDFQDQEKLRIIPNCTHVFHIDCIDIWLQSNSNCPLCRRSISITNQEISPDRVNRDEDYVVIELGDEQSSELSAQSISPVPRKLEHDVVKKKGTRFGGVSSMGDECIDIRRKDEEFSVQPMRRSFSMDSADDRQLYLAVQEIVQGKNSHGSEVRRSFFPFGHGRGSRNAVLPIHLEP